MYENEKRDAPRKMRSRERVSAVVHFQDASPSDAAG